MVAGLRAWERSPLRRDTAVATFDHDGWSVEARRGPARRRRLRVRGASQRLRRRRRRRPHRQHRRDAHRVRRPGHGRGDRRARPRPGAGVSRAAGRHRRRWSRSRSRAAGWALFADDRLALAVARGSGQAVAQLGAVARQAGTPVSAHGTGGAWLVAGVAADADAVRRERHELARPQGVQHAQRLLHPGRHGRRAGPVLPDGARRRRRGARHLRPAARRRRRRAATFRPSASPRR